MVFVYGSSLCYSVAVLKADNRFNFQYCTQGNSGGPLLDGTGKLIGVNTAIYSPSGASAGIGFAIPVDEVKFIVETLIRDGRIVRPVLGISYLGSKQARTLGINSGVLVLDVPEDSLPAKAGLKGTRRTELTTLEHSPSRAKCEAMSDPEALAPTTRTR